MTHRVEHRSLPIIGWREWVRLPVLGVDAIKVKVDTGARSSALHAFDLHLLQRDGRSMVSFEIHPIQRSAKRSIRVEAEVLEFRSVRSSGGHVTRRPVILTPVELLGLCWPIELTLASRDAMGFRMLLGREAVRNRFWVDPSRSFVGGTPATAATGEERTRKRTRKRKRS